MTNDEERLYRIFKNYQDKEKEIYAKNRPPEGYKGLWHKGMAEVVENDKMCHAEMLKFCKDKDITLTSNMISIMFKKYIEENR